MAQSSAHIHHTDVLIIGGGAAGFFAAIRCAELHPDLKIVLLERGKKTLQKVKISGGGRCNVTHACWTPRELSKHYPRGEKALLGPFTRFCTGDTVEWYEQRGVNLKTEADNRMFPTTDDSQTIINCLWQQVQKYHIEVRTQQNVNSLLAPTDDTAHWIVQTSDQTYHADKVMMATGSNPRMWELLAGLGHKIVEPVPSLFTFNIKDERIADLAGLSARKAQVKVSGTKLSATGPLLITHWGMSGPGILKLSAWGARILAEKKYQFEIKVNWLYQLTPDEYGQWDLPNNFPPAYQQYIESGVHFENVRALLQQWKLDAAKKQISTQNVLGLPNRLWKKLCEAAAISPTLKWADANKKQINKLALELTEGSFQVHGKSTFKDEFVTAGGVALKEVNFKRFESKLLPNLFFAGEVLNIDAITGGFNFQAAWTGGWIAGGAMGEG